MPRLRCSSVNLTSTRNTRSAIRKCTNINSDNKLDAFISNAKQTQPTRSILKQANSCTGTRRKRSSLVPISEPIEEKRAQNRRPTLLQKEKEPAPSARTHIKIAVDGKRKKPVDSPKPKTIPDPYAFDALIDSDDEKENIDPKGSVHPIAKPSSSSALPKLKLQSRGRARKVREPVAKQTAPVFISPVPALTGRPSVHFGPSKWIGLGSSPSRPSTGPSIAELERRKSASATIILSLCPNRLTLHNNSVLSVSSLTSTQMLSASTPASQVATTSAYVMNKVEPKVVLSPLSTAALTPPPVLSEAPFHQVTEDVRPDEPAHRPMASPSYSHSEKDERTASSRDRSSGSHSSSSHHRHRKMSDSEREEAYTSWLDEFNAELEKFESHELTVVDEKSPT